MNVRNSRPSKPEDLAALGAFLALGGPSLSAEVVAQAFPGLELFEYRPGAVIVREGESGGDVHFVHSGSVLVVHGRPGTDAREVARLGRGEIFGEIAVLESRPRTASVLAAGESVVWRIPAAEFRAFLASRPALAAGLREQAERRLRRLSEYRPA